MSVESEQALFRHYKRFADGQERLQRAWVVLSAVVVSATARGHSDAVLATIVQDAEDVRKAASDWADDCIALAEQWARQREAEERARGEL